jgi:RNA polymerase sigma-70 factor (ECF subfamily)
MRLPETVRYNGSGPWYRGSNPCLPAKSINNLGHHSLKPILWGFGDSSHSHVTLRFPVRSYRCSEERRRPHGAKAMLNPPDDFEPHRRRLLGLAYRMLGSMADAEDAVQETYLRWHATDRERVSDPRGFLMTTTTRICLNMLTSARARREEYVGPWLPEPVLDPAALAPDSRTELAEDLSIALLLTLDKLSPLERAAFLLHDVFDFSFSEVATALERSEAACRQLAARARGHVRAARPRGATVPAARSGEIDAKHAQLLSAFMAATQSGDLAALTGMLARDVRIVTDGGGKVRSALEVIEGAERAARVILEATRKRPDTWWRKDFTTRFALVNGLPGVLVAAPEGVVQTAAIEIEGDLIRAVYVVRNPDKLRHLAAPAPPPESGGG